MEILVLPDVLLVHSLQPQPPIDLFCTLKALIKSSPGTLWDTTKMEFLCAALNRLFYFNYNTYAALSQWKFFSCLTFFWSILCPSLLLICSGINANTAMRYIILFGHFPKGLQYPQGACQKFSGPFWDTPKIESLYAALNWLFYLNYLCCPEPTEIFVLPDVLLVHSLWTQLPIDLFWL